MDITAILADGSIAYSSIQLVRILVWIVVGIVIGNKAKEAGLSFVPYFLLTWLLGLIGLVISLILINNKKNSYNPYNRFSQYQNPNQYNQYQNQYNPNQNRYNQYGQNGQYNQYGQGQYNQYGQQGYYQQNPYQNAQAPQFHTCQHCGNKQKEGGFCEICGGKLD